MTDVALTKEEIIKMNQTDLEYKGSMISKVVLDIAKPYIKGHLYLDVGAGDGALIREFDRSRIGRKRHISGIDLVPKSKDVAQGDCTDLKWPDCQFDGVFCTDVVEHLRDDYLTKCIKEAHRVLRKGGYLFITTLNNEDIEKRIIACPACTKKFHPYGHCQVFNRRRMAEVLKGFRIVKIKELNLGFIAAFGMPAKIFYRLKLHKLVSAAKLTSDLYVIAQKTEEG